MEKEQFKKTKENDESSRFKGIEDVLSEAKIEEIFQKNKTAVSIHFQSSLKQIVEKLKDFGFREVSPVVLYGSNAIVLEAKNQQMLRIVHCRVEKERAVDDVILQPIETINDISNYRVEILPKVLTIKEIIESDELRKEYNIPSDVNRYVESLVEEIISASELHGKILFDPLLENIGIIKSSEGKNIPIIMDSEAALKISNLPAGVFIQFTRRLLENKEVFRNFRDLNPEVVSLDLEHLEPYDTKKLINAGQNYFNHLKCLALPEVDYASAQEDHKKMLGLEGGAVIDGRNKYKSHSHTTSLHDRLAREAANHSLNKFVR